MENRNKQTHTYRDIQTQKEPCHEHTHKKYGSLTVFE